MNVFAKIIKRILLFITSFFKMVDLEDERIDRIDNFDANIIEENRLIIEGILRTIDFDYGQATHVNDMFRDQVNDLFQQMFCHGPEELLEGQDFSACMVRETSRDIVQATRILKVLRLYLADRVS